MKRTIFLLLLSSTLAQAQWTKVADSTSTGSIQFTSSATYRWGTSTGITTAGVDCSKANCWTTVSVTTGTTIKATSGLPNVAPGLKPELDVYQTSSPQTVIVGGSSVFIPAKTTGGAIYNVTNCPATFSGQVTIDSTGTATLSGAVTISSGCTAIKQ